MIETDRIGEVLALHRQIERGKRRICHECSRRGQLVAFPCRTYRVAAGMEDLREWQYS